MPAEQKHLILRLDAPLQSWGGVAMDPVRPTQRFPSRSGIAGLLASALGWRYRDGERTTDLQDSLRLAVREDRPARLLVDYQTADLGQIGSAGWTRWGVERRGGGAAASGTQILEKHYLADGVFLAAVSLRDGAPAELEEIAQALSHPTRPLFLGRRACIPAAPILAGRTVAPSPYDALAAWPLDLDPARAGDEAPELDCWYEDGDGPEDGEPLEVWDRRDFFTDRFGGGRMIRRAKLTPPAGSTEGDE